MSIRIERVLTKLAHQHAFHLLHTLPEDNTRLQVLADGLARHGVLVVTADMPDQNTDAIVNKWVSMYGSLYTLIIGRLFPSFRDLRATYADNQHPPVVVIQGEVKAVMEALGGYIVPFVALKQHDKLISEAELRGVMAIILDALDGQSINRDIYDQMVRDGIIILHDMLQLPIKHVALTSFARPLFQQLKQQGQQPSPKPPNIPEPPPDDPLTETGKMFRVQIPLNPLIGRHKRDRNGENGGRKPPVRLPPRKNS